MKYLPLLGLLILAACFGVDQSKPDVKDPPVIQRDQSMAELLAAIEHLKRADVSMLTAIERMEKQNSSRLGMIENKVRDLETITARIISSLDALQKGVASQPNGPAKGPEPPPVVPPDGLKDPIAVLSEATDKMKRGEMAKEELVRMASDLRPIATQAVNKFLDELRANLSNGVYVRNFIVLAGALPAENTRVPFGEALKEVRLRGAICETVGKSGQLALSKVLEEFANTADDGFRAQIAEAMVNCKNPAGVPLLLMLLRSQEETLRTIAILTLKPLNKGITFGYDFFLAADSERNRDAIKQWELWYDRNKEDLFK